MVVLMDNVDLEWSLSESVSRVRRKGQIFVLLILLYLIVVSWLIGVLCRVGCRHLHVPQNSRQP